LETNRAIRKRASQALGRFDGQLLRISVTAIVLGGVSLFSFFVVQLLLMAVSLGVRSGRFGAGAQVMKYVYIGLALYLLVSLFVGSAVEWGLDRVMLLRLRGECADQRTLFFYRPAVFDAILLRLFLSVRVTLWSLLLFVPGIVAAMNYAMAPFLLAQNPGMGVPEAIRVSKYLMKGYKRKLLGLLLGYAGEIIISLLLVVPFIYVMPRLKCATAVFFRDRVRLHDEDLKRIQS